MRTYFSARISRVVFPLAFLLAVLLGAFALPTLAQDSPRTASTPQTEGLTSPHAERDGRTGGSDGGTDDSDLGEAARPIREIQNLPSPKTLLFVFDVSGSMKSGGNLQRAREATVTILREAARPGDRVVLFTFGAGTQKVFDKTIASGEDKAELIGQVPTQTETGAGTNIRRPHHESLKIADANLPHDSAIVLLTDSFNDEPKPSDAAYGDYLQYYTPGGQLTKYPKTAENRDYERLLKKLLASGKLHQYGIGINIDENGRPIERLPQAAPPPVEATPAPVQTNATAPTQTGPSPAVWIGLGVGAFTLIGTVLLILPTLQTSVFRITGGPSGPKDFRLKSGQTVRLGGDGASVAWDAYPVPGASQPVAHVKSARGRLVLAPAIGQSGAMKAAPNMPAPTANAPSPARNQNDAPRVYHNGLVLESETPLDFGDEVRIAMPSQAASGGGLAREFRLKFDDPKKI